MNTLNVQLGDRSYDILVGANCLGAVKERMQASTKFLLYDQNVQAFAESMNTGEYSYGETCAAFEATEQAKVLPSIDLICQSMLDAGINRSSVLIAMGGGITGDVGGYAAASYMRGIRYVQVPTTLLAMVDASVGGKTGVNIQGDDGVLLKNMIGAFWQPSLVVADVATLQTLDDRHMRCGIAECIKHALLGNSELLTMLEQKRETIMSRDESTLVDLVTLSASIKASIVEEDEKETGVRALLNLGHTFAHAIEPIPELGLYHGEAVAIGLCAAAALSEAMELIDASQVHFVRSLVKEYQLPTVLPKSQSSTMLMKRMQSDKKHSGAKNRFVVMTENGAQIAEDVSEQLVALAWASVGGQLV